MVEKIIINPNKVRGYGNILSPHSSSDYELEDCTITEDTDTVYGATVNVIVMEPDLGEATTLTVTSSSSTLVLDGTVTISATLKDSSNAAISGATITFKEGTTTLGNSTTNSSGVATYTYTGASVGDHTINAGFAGDSTYASSTGNVSVTVTDHVYSISFNQSSYVATGGSAEVSVTLLDDNVAVTGATVSFTGGTSTVTATTDSSGVATATVTFSASGTLTATYSNVSDTATVTVQSYLFYDDCSTDRRSEYSFISGGSWKTTGSVSYDSTNHCYNITTASSEGLNGLKVNDLTVGNCKITAKLQYNSTNANRQFGIGLLKNTSTFIYARYESLAGGINIVENNATVKTSGTQSLSADTWYTFELIRNGTTLTMSVYNDSGTLLKSIETSSSILSGTDIPYFYFYGGSKNYKIKEAKVEAL